jgi:hypothetical protein
LRISGSAIIGAAAAIKDANKIDQILLVGFDWGTSCSCIHAAFADSSELAVNESIPTLVGYAMEGIMDDILPSNARILFGNEAIKNRLRLRLTKPMADGVIKNLAAAKDFAGAAKAYEAADSLMHVPTTGLALAKADIELSAAEKTLTLTADDEFKMNALWEIIQTRLVRRGARQLHQLMNDQLVRGRGTSGEKPRSAGDWRTRGNPAMVSRNASREKSRDSGVRRFVTAVSTA